MKEWNAVGLRFTFFPKDRLSPEEIEGIRWWEETIGVLPDNRKSNPRLGTLQVDGSFDKGQLALSIDSIKADWIYLVSPNAQANSDTPLTLGSLSEVMATFEKIIKTWLTKQDLPLQRIALGAVLMQETKTLTEAYSVLQNYLASIKIDPNNSDSFFYQINRRRPSKVISGLLLNRVSKWSAAAFSTVEIALGHEENPRETQNIVTYFARLELDVNSVPENPNTLPQEQLIPLFDELKLLGLEIAAEGDIA